MFATVALAFFAATSAPLAAPDVSPAKPVKEKKICRVDEVNTGSLTPKRVCKTKAEWEGRAPSQDATPPRPAQAPGGNR